VFAPRVEESKRLAEKGLDKAAESCYTVKMLKHIDDIRKAARVRAERRWKNHQVEKDFKAARQKAAEEAAKEPKQIEVGDFLEQDKLIKEATTKFESKFLKELRAMLKGHHEQNTFYYIAWLENRKRRCLKEKLKRLRAQEAQEAQEAAQQASGV
jgi:hypothetical protein